MVRGGGFHVIPVRVLILLLAVKKLFLVPLDCCSRLQTESAGGVFGFIALPADYLPGLRQILSDGEAY